MSMGIFKDKIMNGENMDRYSKNIVPPSDENVKIDFNHSDHVMLREMKSSSFNKDMFKGFGAMDNFKKMKMFDLISDKKNKPSFNFGGMKSKPNAMEIFGVYEEYVPGKQTGMKMDEKLDVFNITPMNIKKGKKGKKLDMKGKMDVFSIGRGTTSKQNHGMQSVLDNSSNMQNKLERFVGRSKKKNWRNVIGIDSYSKNEEGDEVVEGESKKDFLTMGGAAAKEVGGKILSVFQRDKISDDIISPSVEEKENKGLLDPTRRPITDMGAVRKIEEVGKEEKSRYDEFKDMHEEKEKPATIEEEKETVAEKIRFRDKWKSPLEVIRGIKSEVDQGEVKKRAFIERKKAMLYTIPDARGKIPDKAYKLDKNYLGYLLWQAHMAKASKRKADPLWAVRQAGMAYGLRGPSKLPDFSSPGMAQKGKLVDTLAGMGGITGEGIRTMSSGVATGAGMTFGGDGLMQTPPFAPQPQPQPQPQQVSYREPIRRPQQSIVPPEEPYQYSDVTEKAPMQVGSKGERYSPYSKRTVSYIRGPYRRKVYYERQEA